MSKRSKEKKPTLSDWDVVLTSYDGIKVTVLSAWWHRDRAGGYTFTDRAGVTSDFAPGIVAYVRRISAPELTPAQKAPAAEAARTELASKRQNGGPDILPVKPHGGKS